MEIDRIYISNLEYRAQFLIEKSGDDLRCEFRFAYCIQHDIHAASSSYTHLNKACELAAVTGIGVG